jgi:hypothetical protein
MKKTIFYIIFFLIVAAAVYLYFNPVDFSWKNNNLMSESEAKMIAEKNCIKGGEALTSGGTYNENSKTWWFDANLNSVQPGCNPACVVFAETKTTEINWRCTGLIEPDQTNAEIIRQLIAQKYNKSIDAVSVVIYKKTENHMRGQLTILNPNIEQGAEGAIWLAAKINGQWQIVHDGNGGIPCSLSQKYGFPQDMLSDCAQGE